MHPQAWPILWQLCVLENRGLRRAPSPREPEAPGLWVASSLKEQKLGCPAPGREH